MSKIVGARIGNTITNDRAMIIEAIDHNRVTEFLDRDRMKFMATMDQGHYWEAIASGPTLFCVDESGKLISS